MARQGMAALFGLVVLCGLTAMSTEAQASGTALVPYVAAEGSGAGTAHSLFRPTLWPQKHTRQPLS